jgi:pyridoxine/pyridoxamine 5'-phosphate oxidase
MAAVGNSSNSIFSDHPSDEQRIRQIQAWLPEARKYYNPSAAAVADAPASPAPAVKSVSLKSLSKSAKK